MMMNFFRDERGATAIEYALIASLIGMVIIGAVGAIGGSLNGTFNEAAGALP
jgi:pilus assembly protein Flp/PilA